ncbi:MAG: MMPL family transporter [Treponema sp.]|nr:MMPL family transporter [Treponema sp.]
MKKKLTLPQSNRFYVWLYVLFHAVAILPFLIMLAAGCGLNLDADLFNMLPRNTESKAMNLADERLSDQTGQSVYVLASHDDFQIAKETAQTVYEQLKDSPKFSSLSLYSDTSAIDEINDFVHQYRWNLLNDSQVQQLSTADGAAQFADSALASAYSAFTMTSLDYLEEDPFLLDETEVQNYLAYVQDAGTAMSSKDGVLASQYEGKWYVLIRGVLSKEGAALASSSNGIAQIYNVCNPLEKDGVRFVYYGTPFHSHESSNSAQHEITFISVVAFSVVIIMLIVVFRSPLPLLSSLFSIIISIATAFSATHAIFGKLHMLTLVFGTSLIGSCIDYSLHYFVNWKANGELKTGSEIRAHLMRGLVLSLLSTEICYCMLLFAPFNLLKQMAVFSMVGIMSSFLTVACMYPLFPIPSETKRHLPVLKLYRVPTLAHKHPKAPLFITVGLLALAGLVLGISHKNVKVLNDVYRLYTMKGRLEEDTKLADKVIAYLPGAWFVVSGNDVQQLLENEEAVTQKLVEINKGKTGGGLVATSRFIPSIKKQKASYKAAANLLPLAEEQYDMFGYESEYASDLEQLYREADGQYLTPDAQLPEEIASLIGSLWLGEIDGKYYSVVMPTSITDEAAYRAIDAASDDVFFMDKISDIGQSLDSLTKIILLMFAIAYVVIVVVLKFFYDWKQTLKIASIPLLSVATIVAVFAAKGDYLEFFGITGMILVFGLGLDYVIYMIENNKRHATVDSLNTEKAKLEPFAILLSFVTTAVSFGALAISTFVPVHSLGLAIFLGLVSAFVATLF